MSVFRILGVLLIWLISGEIALANAPDRSQRPQARPVGTSQYVPRQIAVPIVQYNARFRPTPRPVGAPNTTDADVSQAHPDVVVFLRKAPGVQRSLRPTKRPTNMRRLMARAQNADVVQIAAEVRGPRRGSVCGDRAIRGQAVARIRGRISACGIAKPVRITEVDGVRLSTAATLDCTTAKALKRWVHNGAKPAVGRMGGGIKSLRVVAHYACRTRNNQAGAKISEHAKGRAIDIAAINLNNGTSITVLTDWRKGRQGRVLKRMHKAACGIFGTVLGPNANRYHRDHFHFDTARHRSGSYCR